MQSVMSLSGFQECTTGITNLHSPLAYCASQLICLGHPLCKAPFLCGPSWRDRLLVLHGNRHFTLGVLLLWPQTWRFQSCAAGCSISWLLQKHADICHCNLKLYQFWLRVARKFGIENLHTLVLGGAFWLTWLNMTDKSFGVCVSF